MEMRGNDAETGPLTSSTHLLLPGCTPLERRLSFLIDDVVCTLADDQALLAEGIIMAYRSMATAGTLVEVREGQVAGMGTAMAAPSIMTCASQLNDLAKNHHKTRSGNNSYYNTCEMSEALLLLREIDKAMAWCEGKMAITAKLFPPVTTSPFNQSGSSPNNDGIAQRVRSVSPKPDSASSRWMDSQEVQHGGVRTRYYEGPDGNIHSRSRSHVWVPDTPPSSSTYLTVPGGSVACNLDFDRWTARQISCQAQHDSWRLLLLRCVAEECVRRHTVIIEERLGRITLLVAAREEVTARVELRARGEALDRQREFPACTVGAVQKKKTLLEEGRQGPLRGADHETKETQTLVSGSCAADVGWSEFTHALLCESEGTQRVGIVKEAQLSRQLLLAQWQSVVNHMGGRRLLAAKEGRIRELAKPHSNSNSNSNSTPCRGAASCNVLASSVARVPEMATAAAAAAVSVVVVGQCSSDAVIPSPPPPILTAAPAPLQRSRTRRTRGGGASDIPLHIFTGVEGVERKQLALTEQRAWQELTSRLEAEWKRYERQCS